MQITQEEAKQILAKIKPGKWGVSDIERARDRFKQIAEATVRFHGDVCDFGVSSRNLVCFQNMCRQLKQGDYETALWELKDIIDYHQAEDLLSVSEVAFLYAALEVFAMILETNLAGK